MKSGEMGSFFWSLVDIEYTAAPICDQVGVTSDQVV